jgi:glycosyltransferase involved in cell wall biosynthesis
MLLSLRAQDWPSCQVLVRDDGSDDTTCELLHAQAWPDLTLVTGPNVGAKASFGLLLAMAPDCDAILFADQDDVWHRDKVRRAMLALGRVPADIPVLYCTALDIVDENLKRLATSPIWPRPPAFGNALVENIATGCTIALNRAAVDLLRSHPFPNGMIMHDWWAYLVISAFGQVIYDPEPSLLYRMHGQNQVGLPTDRAGWLLDKVRRRWRGGTLARLIEQAEAFDRFFGGRLGAEQRAMLDQLLAIRSYAGRLEFLRRPRIYRQFGSDQLAFTALVLAGAS